MAMHVLWTLLCTLSCSSVSVLVSNSDRVLLEKLLMCVRLAWWWHFFCIWPCNVSRCQGLWLMSNVNSFLSFEFAFVAWHYLIFADTTHVRIITPCFIWFAAHTTRFPVWWTSISSSIFLFLDLFRPCLLFIKLSASVSLFIFIEEWASIVDSEFLFFESVFLFFSSSIVLTA